MSKKCFAFWRVLYYNFETT
jgi:hypothetical protein